MKTSYSAFFHVVKQGELSPHLNANNLQILYWNTIQFVVGKDISVGDSVIIFPPGGKLEHSFAYHNNLYRDSVHNLDSNISGFFEQSLAIKTLRLRQEPSYGFVASIHCFDYLGEINLKDGDEFDTINGELICQKYMSNATLIARKDQTTKVHPKTELPRHYDTTDLYKVIETLPEEIEGATLTVTEKLHGTSGRTGYLKKNKTFLEKVLGVFFKKYRENYVYITGSRNVIIDTTADTFRTRIHNRIIGELEPGMVVYYEIVGYDHNGKAIQSHGSPKGLNNAQLASSNISRPLEYAYGCKKGECDFYIYRITQDGRDWSITEIICWCYKRFKCVPEVLSVRTSKVKEAIVGCVQDMNNSIVSQLDSNTVKEGYCFRLDFENGTHKVYKTKTELFLQLEHQARVANYLDMEEAA